jgi:hypothetical protein
MGVGRWMRDARYLEFLRPQDARHFKFVRPSFFSARPRTPRHQNFDVQALISASGTPGRTLTETLVAG